MNTGLENAVAIFKELGWADATPEQAVSLPLGTVEQRRTALAGLKSGEWGGIVQDGNTYSWKAFFDVDRGMLGLFAVRLGVDARRTVQVVPRFNRFPDSILTPILAERGPAFASSFIKAACRAGRNFAAPFGSVPVRLLAHHQLAIPDNLGYLEDWAHYADSTLRKVEAWDVGLDLVPVITDRFAEHVRMGVALGIAGMGPFRTVVTEGVSRGLLDRDETVELVFAALDSASRPGDRKAWLQVLDELGVTDNELVARTDALIPLLANGDSFLVERIAPVLIARVDGPAFIDVLVTSLSTQVKKTLKIVLQAAATRGRPERAEELAPQLADLANDRDRAVARLASSIVASWGLESTSEETTLKTPVAFQGLWQPTPPVWQVPRFERGQETPEALTDLAAELTGRPEGIDDVTVERFLAVANSVAYADVEAAKTALRGVRGFPDANGLRPVPTWLKKEQPPWGLDHDRTVTSRIDGTLRSHVEKFVANLLTAREYAVFQRLGEVPCLLSEPSTDDLAITVSDLVSRLETYQATGAAATEVDLFLALTRLDTSSSTPELMARLDELPVPVVLQSGEMMAGTAGPIAARYLADPIVEPQLVINSRGIFWEPKPIAPRGDVKQSAPITALSEAGFPDRLSQYPTFQSHAAFPHWGDAALRGGVRWTGEVQHEIGLVLRQVARRATPLPPGGAINFLAAQRPMSAKTASDGVIAVTEAWERGLLRPGVADVAYLDWRKEPSNIAALATALVEVAQSGLISVVWPVLDDVIALSLKASRLLAGTAELAEAIHTLLPEVVAAVSGGLADPSALDLPATRALARRTGSSRAVVVAREIAEQLPPPTVVEPAPAATSADAPLDPPFNEAWPAGAGELAAIPDGVKVCADWRNPDGPTRVLDFTLALPHMPNVRFLVRKTDWIYDLEKEGQCAGKEIHLGAPDSDVKTVFVDPDGYVLAGQPDVWLHWDVDQSRLVVTEKRNWRQDKDGPLFGRPATPLSNALVTVAVGLLGHDADHAWGGKRLVSILADVYSSRDLDEPQVRRERFGSAAVTQAVRTLLNSPAVSMAKLVKPLEKDVNLLPTLWPLLIEPIRFAGVTMDNTSVPAWLNRVLDVALRHAPYLAEATRRGLIESEAATWPGLAEIAGRKDKSTAIAKAKKLLAALELT